MKTIATASNLDSLETDEKRRENQTPVQGLGMTSNYRWDGTAHVTNVSFDPVDTSDRRGSRPILSTMARKFFILALLAAFIGMTCAGTTPEGIEYLKANKLKEGVVETKDGDVNPGD